MVNYNTGGATPAAWQFSVTAAAYGAKGDGQVVTDGAMTSGSAALTCTTSTPFKSTDVGKHIIVNGAGADGTSALVTTISGFTDTGHVTLAATAGTTASGAAVLWSSDDTAAIQAAINAAAVYAAAHGYAQVYLPAPPAGVFYGVAGALVTTGSANSQLVIPNPTGTAAQYTLEFDAQQGPGTLNMWTQTAMPQALGGLVSYGIFANASAALTNYNTFGPYAVLGSTPAEPSLLANVDGLPAFANICVVVRNWTTLRPQATHGLGYSGINLGGCSKGYMEGCASLLTSNYSISSGSNALPSTSTFQDAHSTGLILPYNGNNDMAIARNCTCTGDAFGFQIGEHATLDSCRVIGASFIAQISGNDGASNGHMMKIINMSAEQCSFGFWVVGNGQSGIGMFLDAEIDIEGLGSAHSLIQDNNTGGGLSSLYGQIRVNGSQSLTYFPTLYPTSVKLYSVGGNGGQVPGYVSGYTGFSSAGSNVAVQNPYWRDVKVHFSAGTITAVKAGATLGGSGGSATTAPSMVTTGLSGSGEVDWPSGGWLSFTYTGVPVWNVQVPV